MYRPSKPIPELKQDKIPKRLVIFDTESYQGVSRGDYEYQAIRLGVARFMELDIMGRATSSQYYNFSDGESLATWIDYLTRKDKTLYVYAHNLKYDLQLSGLFTILLSQGWLPSLFVLEDPPTFIRLKKGRKSIMMIDTFNYWQFSLSKMGEQLDFPKIEMPEWGASDAQWFAYCKRDVEVLSLYLTNFITFLIGENLAPLGLTTASQAFRAYRKRFLSHDIHIHNRREVLNLEREGYSGGRVEALHIGSLSGADFYKLDVNSMYPFVMKNNLYPVELLGYSESLPLDRLPGLLENFYVMADVSLSSDVPAYPLKYGGKLVFPIGEFSTVLHHTELSYARDKGHLKSIDRVAVYRKADIFSPYVDFFYRLKCKAEEDDNPVLRQQAKLFLNSLYGKFGQRGVVSKIVNNPEGYKFGRITGYSESLGRQVEINYLGDKIEIRYPKGESAYSFPAIAGAVTANARLFLWSLITSADPSNVYYYDTDSLFVNQQGFINLAHELDDHKLGGLKVEEVARSVTIYGLKDYKFGDTVKHKGVPNRAVQIDRDTWQYDQFLGAKTWVKDGMKTGVIIKPVEKRRLNVYDKGLITLSGRVIPLTLTGRDD